jgi:hypothetical protein
VNFHLSLEHNNIKIIYVFFKSRKFQQPLSWKPYIIELSQCQISIQEVKGLSMFKSFCSKRGNLNCNGHTIQHDRDILKYLRCENSRHLRDTISLQQTARIRLSYMYTAINELHESCFEFSEG